MVTADVPLDFPFCSGRVIVAAWKNLTHWFSSFSSHLKFEGGCVCTVHSQVDLEIHWLRSGRSARSQCMEHLKRITQAVIAAEQLVLDGNAPGQLQAVLKDVGWANETFSRELMFLLRSSGFNIDNDIKLRQLLWRFCNGSNSTQSILESAFAHLRDIAQRQAKALKLNPYCLWMYAVGCPYVEKSGMAQLLPTATDWLRHAPLLGRSAEPLAQVFKRLFKLEKTILPKGEDIDLPCNAAGVAKTGWRNAGPLSHYKSSAATAFLTRDVKFNFVNASSAWAASVLCQKGVFYNTGDGSFWLSLGFMVWCSLGVRLVLLRCNDKEGQGFWAWAVTIKKTFQVKVESEILSNLSKLWFFCFFFDHVPIHGLMRSTWWLTRSASWTTCSTLMSLKLGHGSEWSLRTVPQLVFQKSLRTVGAVGKWFTKTGCHWKRAFVTKACACVFRIWSRFLLPLASTHLQSQALGKRVASSKLIGAEFLWTLSSPSALLMISRRIWSSICAAPATGL